MNENEISAVVQPNEVEDHHQQACFNPDASHRNTMKPWDASTSEQGGNKWQVGRSYGTTIHLRSEPEHGRIYCDVHPDRIPNIRQTFKSSPASLKVDPLSRCQITGQNSNVLIRDNTQDQNEELKALETVSNAETTRKLVYRPKIPRQREDIQRGERRTTIGNFEGKRAMPDAFDYCPLAVPPLGCLNISEQPSTQSYVPYQSIRSM